MSRSGQNRKATLILLGVFIIGLGIFLVPRLQAAVLNYTYPPDTNVLITRSLEPNDFSTVSNGSAITVTIDVANNEDVALRGVYYSDQVPNGWAVNTTGVSANGSPVADYVYGQGHPDEIYPGFTPHRWALEMPQGNGIFSPTHPISALGGTAQIVYTMIVSGGTGSDYSVDHNGWAGWLETTIPTGTAVFGYQVITSSLSADFTAEPRSSAAPLTVQFTDLSTGNPTAWTWDFGDSTPVDSQQHPTYTYTIPGIYTVTLDITGPTGSDQAIKPAYITVTVPPPTADFTASSRSGVAPFIVTFADLSAGDITDWLWQFGDGLTSTVQHPTHTYTVTGQFGVTLTVSGPGGYDVISKPGYIVVGPDFAPPLADFSASPQTGTVPLLVTFTDLSQGDVTTWLWNLGDGIIRTVQSPTHTYTMPGIYTVTLTVSHTESMDSDTIIKPNFITVTAPPLQADFVAQPRSGSPPLTVQFTDLSIGNILTRSWNFGDRGTALPPGTVSPPGKFHTYNNLGYYTVTLTVQDAYGSDILIRPRYIYVTDISHNVYIPVVLKNYVPQRRWRITYYMSRAL